MAGGDGCWQQLICPKLAWLPAGTWLATISGPASQPLRRKEEEGQSRLEGTNHKRKKHSNVITQKEIIFTKNVSNRLDKYHCYLVVLTSNLSNDGVLHMMGFQKTKQKCLWYSIIYHKISRKYLNLVSAINKQEQCRMYTYPSCCSQWLRGSLMFPWPPMMLETWISLCWCSCGINPFRRFQAWSEPQSSGNIQ